MKYDDTFEDYNVYLVNTLTNEKRAIYTSEQPDLCRLLDEEWVINLHNRTLFIGVSENIKHELVGQIVELYKYMCKNVIPKKIRLKERLKEEEEAHKKKLKETERIRNLRKEEKKEEREEREERRKKEEEIERDKNKWVIKFMENKNDYNNIYIFYEDNYGLKKQKVIDMNVTSGYLRNDDINPLTILNENEDGFNYSYLKDYDNKEVFRDFDEESKNEIFEKILPSWLVTK